MEFDICVAHIPDLNILFRDVVLRNTVSINSMILEA
jgi:hypothetical protein